MAIRRRRHKHQGRGERKKHADELSARLAPLEELNPEFAVEPRDGEGEEAGGGAAYNDATIRVGSASVEMPKDLVEGEREGSRIFRLDPVVLFILCAMLAFIAFIAWQISQTPPPAAK